MPMNWTAAADQKLLLAIIGQCNVKISTEDYDALAAVMGSGCTPKAIKMRMSKIRANAATVEENGSEAAADDEDDAPPPPEKKKSAAKKGGKSGSEKKDAKKRKFNLIEQSEDEIEDKVDGPQKVKVEEGEGVFGLRDWDFT